MKPTLSSKLASFIIIFCALVALTILFVMRGNAQSMPKVLPDVVQPMKLVYYNTLYFALQHSESTGDYITLEDKTILPIASVERVRATSATIVDNGDGTATYKGTAYKIETGSRGGRFITVNGTKKYIPKSK